MITLTEIECNKHQRLYGIDMLNVHRTKLLNSIKAKEYNIGLFRDYWVSIRLYKLFEIKNLPINIMTIVERN